MSENAKERAVLFFLIALLVIGFAGLANALIVENLENQRLQAYVVRVEHTPCQTTGELYARP